MPGDFPDYGPEVEVWNHLETGWQLADDELDVLEPELRRITVAVAKLLVDSRGLLIVEEKLDPILQVDSALLAHPWIGYAAELEVASEGTRRATAAFERFRLLQPVIGARQLPDRAVRYIKEASQTFLFGFDAACIALCRATLEQVLRDVLVSRSVYTEAQLKREQPTGGALLENAKRERLLEREYGAAKRVMDQGNHLLHRAMYDEKLLKQMAADSVRDLCRACVELLTV